ncbi:MAG TPA: SURF1 family protein [Stellaceae bacterium]|jgi:surfeit locus 1 family protein|nr:SURF1 family protein [Stellaceae bacterium]
MFRPRLGPTLFSMTMTCICIGLGVWQLQRLEWKRGLIAQRQAALAAPPAPVPQSHGDISGRELHPVTDTGEFLNDRETLIHAIGPKGGAGFDVLTPLREASGRIVMVNRGYVPSERKDRARREAGEPAGSVRVTGLLRLPLAAKPGWFIPENHPEIGSWFWLDLTAVAAAEHLGNVAPFYIDADATPNPGGWPQGRAAPPELPNNHLQYAITWFSLAAAAVLIYVLSQRHPVTSDDRIPRT